MIPLVNSVNKYASLKKTGRISLFIKRRFVFTNLIGIAVIIQGICVQMNNVFLKPCLMFINCQTHFYVFILQLPNMKYSITYEPIDDIIIATVHGDASLGLMSKMVAEIADHIKETNSQRLIKDMRNARLKMSLMDLHALPGMFQAAAFSRGISLKDLQRALVSEKRHDMIEMQELFERHIGSSFRHFYTLDDAKLWLLAEHKTPVA